METTCVCVCVRVWCVCVRDVRDLGVLYWLPRFHMIFVFTTPFKKLLVFFGFVSAMEGHWRGTCPIGYCEYVAIGVVGYCSLIGCQWVLYHRARPPRQAIREDCGETSWNVASRMTYFRRWNAHMCDLSALLIWVFVAFHWLIRLPISDQMVCPYICKFQSLQAS